MILQCDCCGLEHVKAVTRLLTAYASVTPKPQIGIDLLEFFDNA